LLLVEQAVKKASALLLRTAVPSSVEVRTQLEQVLSELGLVAKLALDRCDDAAAVNLVLPVRTQTASPRQLSVRPTAS
jgi:hypothetical protein